MRTAETMIAAAHEYARRFSAPDRQAWLELFVEAPTIIEPADAEPRGREALEQSFDAIKSAGISVALEPLRVIANGCDAAMHMRIRVTMPDGETRENSAIEVFTFAEDGRIAAMRAFLDADQLP